MASMSQSPESMRWIEIAFANFLAGPNFVLDSIVECCFFKYLLLMLFILPRYLKGAHRGTSSAVLLSSLCV